MVIVDLACGQRKLEGSIGVDICDLPGVDIVHDLEITPWPFTDNSVDEVHCAHYIEHTKDIILFMDELYRVLKTGAKATIIAPYYSSVRAWQDPTHTREISECTFLYYNKAWRESNGLSHYNIKSNFEFTVGYNLDPVWEKRSDIAKMFAIKHYINVVNDIVVNLIKC